MKKVKNQIIYLLLAVLMFWSCNSKKENDQPNDQGEWNFGQDVYVAGFENNAQKNSVARLWKNGKLQHLENGQDNILNSSGEYGELYESKAYSVFVSDNDVYVTGYEMFRKNIELPNGTRWKYTTRARLWKNGIMQNLSNEGLDDMAFSVFVSDGDVYVLGYEEEMELSKIYLKLWKNGVSTIFAEGGYNLRAYSLFVFDGDTYVAGMNNVFDPYNGSKDQAKLWKNGIEEELEIGTVGSYGYSVYVSEGDVYVGGTNNGKAALWKNGRLETIANGRDFSEVRCVYISGDDIYLAGHIDQSGRLWKNSIEQNLGDAKNANLFYSVFTISEDVYLAGYEKIQNGSNPDFRVRSKAYLYRNGKKLNLDLGHDFDSEAYSIFVK